jgi:hypothetical protein
MPTVGAGDDFEFAAAPVRATGSPPPRRPEPPVEPTRGRTAEAPATWRAVACIAVLAAAAYIVTGPGLSRVRAVLVPQERSSQGPAPRPAAAPLPAAGAVRRVTVTQNPSRPAPGPSPAQVQPARPFVAPPAAVASVPDKAASKPPPVAATPAEAPSAEPIAAGTSGPRPHADEAMPPGFDAVPLASAVPTGRAPLADDGATFCPVTPGLASRRAARHPGGRSPTASR